MVTVPFYVHHSLKVISFIYYRVPFYHLPDHGSFIAEKPTSDREYYYGCPVEDTDKNSACLPPPIYI
jgi:hypothetical protein